jgi:hypothetical protein|tara:strand:+ start:2568 stop:2849 length:282 start_codon:yes stop_codon:yes gene_type:complete
MKDKMILIILVSLLFALIVILFSFVSTQGITGEVVANKYSYTKAICNSTNYCEDYEIACQDGSAISISTTGFAIQNSLDWKDPRSNKTRNKIC